MEHKRDSMKVVENCRWQENRGQKVYRTVPIIQGVDGCWGNGELRGHFRWRLQELPFPVAFQPFFTELLYPWDLKLRTILGNMIPFKLFLLDDSKLYLIFFAYDAYSSSFYSHNTHLNSVSSETLDNARNFTITQ